MIRDWNFHHTMVAEKKHDAHLYARPQLQAMMPRLPLTSVSGCSSLHVESFPGRADFHAIEGEEGDMVRDTDAASFADD